MGRSPSIGELVSVAEVETVVRLDGPGGHLAQLVLTGDVALALGEVLGASAGQAGGAFFVIGPFGSGKSHFLSAVGELLAAGAPPAGWGAEVAEAAAKARRALPVRVPLVDYRALRALEDVVLGRAWRALGLGPPLSGPERGEAWDSLLGAAQKAGHEGLVLLVDEASEWLKARRGPELTEDLRFLQFLGEWARGRPAVVLVALQEAIEEVANVSERELARIRDRYGALHLSMRHVEDLVRGRLVRFEPGAEHLVEEVGKEVAASFPGVSFDRERLLRSYPLHPATLDLLEGLKFLLSQNRGVVDFVSRETRADLARPASALVTPERIYDHFSERLHERRESARLADAVVPYYERAATELFEDPADRALALRTVKLLCLLAASPLERPRSAAELAQMLLAKVSTADPAANVAYFEKVVLAPLVARGAYVVAHPGRPPTYSVDAGANAAVALEGRLAAVGAELNLADRRIVATLLLLGSTPGLNLELMRQQGFARREFTWQNTLRAATVGLARVAELSPDEVERLVAAAREARSEGVLILAEPELGLAEELTDRARSLAQLSSRLAVWAPAVPSAEELGSLAELHARKVVREQVKAEGRGDLAELLERSREPDAARAREVLRRLYYSGEVFVAGDGEDERARPDLPSLSGLAFEGQLAQVFGPVLTQLHPLHAQVAPRAELVGPRHVRPLLEEVVAPGRLGAASLERGGLRSLVELYLVPLGLARSRKDGVALAPDPARSVAVAELIRLVGEGAPVAALQVVSQLAEGQVGLTEPEALLVINACAQVGLVEFWRGREKVSGVLSALTAADKLGPGELVEPSLREAIAALSPAVTGPLPLDPWTSSTQREAWEYAKAWLGARQEEAAQVRSGLARLEEVGPLAVVDTTSAQADLVGLQDVAAACDGAASPAAGLRGLAGAASSLGGASELVSLGRRLSALARFFRDDLGRVEEALSYVASPELVLPEGGEDGGCLESLRASALGAVPGLLRLACEDRLGEFWSANREFRSAYVAAYREEHEAYYGAVTPATVAKVAESAVYKALAALSRVGAIAVPDDKVKVDRLVAASAPAPCLRRVDLELAWRPKCACGFVIGWPVPRLDVEAVLAVAGRGLSEHLAELSNPSVQEQLEEAASQLEALGRDGLASDLRRLLEVARGPEVADPVVVASLVGEELQALLREVLSGNRLIVTRDLAVLRDDLIGRRYPKRRLLELLASWADPDGSTPATGFIEVVDSTEGTVAVLGGRGAGAGLGPGLRPRRGSATVEFLRARFPELASALPAEQAADAFWLAVWWAGEGAGVAPARPLALPSWVPRRLMEAPQLWQAAEAAAAEPGPLGELADLDARCGRGSVLGAQVEAALGLASASLAEVCSVLASERLLRLPLSLAAEELARRLVANWQAAERFEGPVAPSHFLVAPGELAALEHLLAAARHLGAVERQLAGCSCAELVEDLYAGQLSFVPELLSRASLAAAGRSLVGPRAIEDFRRGAERLMRAADGLFCDFARAGFPGCLGVADIGRVVIDPLLAASGRVAVVLVDAMRADAGRLLAAELARALPERQFEWRWGVVPAPTRTAEAMAALSLGHPVPAGSAASGPNFPFGHLGYEVALLKGADRDDQAGRLRELWASSSPVMVAVALALDERLHHSSVELATLLDDAARTVSRRLLASLVALPAGAPVVLMADHGFRENPSWGKGPEGRYLHGGTSLEECVVPVVVAR